MSNLLLRLRHWGTTRSERPALIDARTRQVLSYGELMHLIGAFGGFLEAAGVAPGERVTILSPNSFRIALSIIASLANGIVANPVNPALGRSRSDAFVEHAAPALVLTDGEEISPAAPRPGRATAAIENAFAVRPAPRWYERASSSGGLLVYTSGTTGYAKGVLLSASSIDANVAAAAAAFGYGPGWTSACLLPLYHTFGIISDVLPMLLTGGAAVVLPAFELRAVKTIVDAFRTYDVQSYSAAPVIFDGFLALNALTRTTLRFAVAGAAPLTERTRLEYGRRFGHPIVPCYGLSESTCFATISPLAAIRPGSAGNAAAIEVRVCDERGEQTAGTGEIALRGRSVVREYFRDGGRHAEAFTADGWFLTGDLGRMDADGYVYVTGRKKNMVIRGGEKVYLEDVDRILAELDDVSESASIAISVPGEPDRAVTFVVARAPAVLAREALAAHVRTGLSPRHVPDEILVVDTIPRTLTGKLKHAELHAAYTASPSGPADPGPGG